MRCSLVRRSLKSDTTALRHGLRGIEHEVEHHLENLSLIYIDIYIALLWFKLQFDLLLVELKAHKFECVINQGIEVLSRMHAFAGATKAQHPLDDFL